MEPSNGNAIPMKEAQRTPRLSIATFVELDQEEQHQGQAIDINHKLIPQYVRPIENSLKLLGLLPVLPVKSNCLSYLLLMYHIAVWTTSVALLIIRFASYSIQLKHRDGVSTGVAMAILVMLHILALKICIMVYVAYQFARKRKLIYDLWEEYKMTHGGDWEPLLKRKVFWMIIFCWIFTVGYCSLVWVVYFISDSSRKFQKRWIVFSVFPHPPESFMAGLISLTYQVVYICHPTAIMYMILGLFFVLVSDITHDFQEMNKEFAEKLKSGQTHEIVTVFSMYHEKHKLLCDFLKEIDRLFSPMVLSVFACGITVICLAIYTVVRSPSSEQFYWILSITMPLAIFFMTLMVTMAFFGATLSKSVSDVGFLHLRQ